MKITLLKLDLLAVAFVATTVVVLSLTMFSNNVMANSEGDTYTIRDIHKVLYADFFPDGYEGNERHRVFTVKLDDGSVLTLKWYPVKKSLADTFHDSGFSGEVDHVMEMAFAQWEYAELLGYDIDAPTPTYTLKNLLDGVGPDAEEDPYWAEVAADISALNDAIKNSNEAIGPVDNAENDSDDNSVNDDYVSSITTESMLKEIQALEKIIKDLQEQIKNKNAASNPTAVSGSMAPWCSVNWSRTLSVGDRGEDVRALQKLLNAKLQTPVSYSGEGAPGYETDYFGPATASALVRFQNQYSEEILKPAGLFNGSGYFGDFSIKWIKKHCN